MRLLLFVIFAFSNILLSAQDTTEIFVKDSIQYSPKRFGVGIMPAWFDPNPHVSYNWSRHKIGIGVRLGKSPIYEINVTDTSVYSFYSRQNYGYKGVRAFYRFHPWKPRRTFNLHFEMSIYYLQLKNLVNGIEHQKINSFTNLIGFGHTQKFLKRFEFFQTFYLGANLVFAKDRYLEYGTNLENKYAIYSPARFTIAYFLGIEIFLF